MKTVIDLNGNEIQVADDTAVRTEGGKHYLLTTKEQSELDARATAWQAESVVRNALVEIARLEAQITPRRIREAVLGTDNGWLATQESLIALERAKL